MIDVNGHDWERIRLRNIIGHDMTVCVNCKCPDTDYAAKQLCRK